ncbi:MAG: hypothetical protein AB7P18_30330 [Candidatus Binatia bacterium]
MGRVRKKEARYSVSLHSVAFWLNAFLPRDISGATTVLRQGQFAGYTAITGPLSCLTDQRNFSADLRARARMHSQVTIDWTQETPIISQAHRCDPVIECDPQTGEVRSQRKAHTNRMGFSLRSVTPQLAVSMNCSASNPSASARWAFDDIEYNGVITFDPQTRTLAIDVNIGLFPAFEAYVAINDGFPTTVFRYTPPVGFGVGRVPAGANRPMRVRLRDREGNGIFELP